ncbi:EF-hand domain-containing protein [Saccharopolyspora sp. NPDC047091]|uniref:EF-hand domain-containing protein n=1 Tax=Saccharopolyspora sp. NPDC047091 TaxID=3155924 RepID=UPI003407CEBB
MSTAIANDRLRKRFAKWDLDGSGSLERNDFVQEAEKIARAFDTSAQSPQAQLLREAFTTMFDHLASRAGQAPTGSLSEEQFLQVAEGMVTPGGEADFDRVMRPVVQGIVGLCDKNDDGVIDAGEFASWLTAVGVDRSQAASAFVDIDTNGDGELSLEELLASVRDFHFGRSDVELLG